MISFRIILILAFGPIFSLCQKAPIVNTTLGTVLGTIELSRNGTKYFSFRGIRYAKPPVGDLRFKPPVPIESWNGTLDATKDGPSCLQPWSNFTSEDCLHLNVYSRRITEVDDPRPVLFYIHGGGFIAGTGSSQVFGPRYLMDHGIVVVTMTYRLGTMGFLSTGDEEAPGNYGMKDQVEALRWVHHNIKHFGGDHTRITVAGESAGAASVGLHMLSPMSRGLFHRAITESGSAANSWAVDRKPLKTAKIVAELLKCPTNTTKDIMSCIRKVPAEDLANVFGKTLPPDVSFTPVVEKSVVHDSERFLTEDPYKSLKEGDVAHVPLMVGTTRDEFFGSALSIIQNKSSADALSDNWNELLPVTCGYEKNDTISELLRSFYFSDINKPITNDSFQALGELFSDCAIIFGTVQSAQIISAANPEPVYLYQFNYRGKYSSSYWPGTNETYGVLHADELRYLVYSKVDDPYSINATDEEDGPVVDRFTTLWVNFVETGNPTPQPMIVLDNAIWKPFKPDKPVYLDINKNLTLIETLYFKDRMSFWNNLSPLDKRI